MRNVFQYMTIQKQFIFSTVSMIGNIIEEVY